MQNIKLQIQTILYNNDIDHVLRSAAALNEAVNYAQINGLISTAVLYYGDSSPEPLFSSDEIERLNIELENVSVRYVFFNKNMGSAAGQNHLALGSDADFLFITNPDIIPTKNIFLELCRPFEAFRDAGAAECKQLPVEHPKDFDRVTGETSWALGSCTFIKRSIFEAMDGYDAENFFLYCDDVDLSWRLRLSGYKIYFVPTAAFFHDKRFGAAGEWLPGDAEIFYSAEAAMLMAYKWSYFELFQEIMQDHENSTHPLHQKAVQAIRERIDQDRMPRPIDAGHVAGEIVDKHYGKMRFII